MILQVEIVPEQLSWVAEFAVEHDDDLGGGLQDRQELACQQLLAVVV